MAKGKESRLVEKVLRELRQRGHEAVKIHGGAFGQKSEPDIHACIAGRFAAIELKVPGNKPTPHQHYRLERWRKAGALAAWFDSFDAFVAWLDGVSAPSDTLVRNRRGTGDADQDTNSTQAHSSKRAHD